MNTKIKKHVGQITHSYKVKSLPVRIRNGFKKVSLKQPTVSIISNQHGEKFKILQFHKNSTSESVRIREIYHKVQSMVNIPEIIYESDHKLIAKYIVGNFPDFSDTKFLSTVATQLGTLHSSTMYLAKTNRLKKKVLEDIEHLQTKAVLDKKQAHDLNRFIEKELPQKCYFSATYADHNKGNFILDSEDKVHLIDLGSFQDSIPLEMHFTYGPFSTIKNNDCFKSIYREFVPNEKVQHLDRILLCCRILSGLRSNAQMLEYSSWAGIHGKLFHSIDYRLKRAKIKNIKNLLTNLAAFKFIK